MDEQGVWQLSPAYDITFSFGPGGEHSTMYLGEGKNPTKEHLRKLGEKHGIKKRETILQEVEASVQRWSELAAKAGVSDVMHKKIDQYLKAR
jgi:serine/threonine-protein kinase HipA